jgi:hypothetical protein
MTTKMVCRVLDAENQLLGWALVWAVARGDGQLWSDGPVTIPIERAGDARTLSLHWCDVHVETRVPLGVPVSVGQPLTVYAQAMPIMRVGQVPGPLPAVTVGSVAVAVPVGQIGTQGYR